MAEGELEKFPDHWDPEYFWTIIVEYLSHGHPVGVKRQVSSILNNTVNLID